MYSTPRNIEETIYGKVALMKRKKNILYSMSYNYFHFQS